MSFYLSKIKVNEKLGLALIKFSVVCMIKQINDMKKIDC